MKNFLHELYHGRFPKWESNRNNPEIDILYKKIKREREYFASVLSAEDYERFKALEKLHKASHAIRDKHICINAFRMGAMHICAVLFGEDEKFDDEF